MLLHKPAPEPAPGVWASPITDEAFWASFTTFQGDFLAGGLKNKLDCWDTTFSTMGVALPKSLRCWLSDGYSVHVEKCNIWGKTPRKECLSQDEKVWVMSKIQSLLQIGAVEPVVQAELPSQAVVCNVVVAYKERHMDRMCWSGKAINKGLDKKRF